MIIKSLLDTDLYKFTMLNALLETSRRIKWFGHPSVRYKFKCRSGERFTNHMAERIKKEIVHFQSLRCQNDEIRYLRSLNIFGAPFFEFISSQFCIGGVVDVYFNNGELEIEIKGPWMSTILYEVPVLSIVNEVYYEDKRMDRSKAKTRLEIKLETLRESSLHNPHLIMEFGTRRRYSREWQEYVVKRFTQEGKNLFYVGSSNVLLSKMNKTVPKGTMAHEWIQAFQALSPNLRDFQKDAMDQWMLTYRGKLDVALSDVIGCKAFFDDFDMLLSRAYGGIRHDSGDPYQFVIKACNHYSNLGIDTATKKIIFSDGLDVNKCRQIKDFCKPYRIQPLFGIGTNLTNDVGFKPLQIVIKLVEVNGNPVAKLSDSPGKEMCEDRTFVKTLKETFNLEKK